ncbi:MAG: glycosyl-4,4'-diaponeurosporenoate acyltransferase [Clostridium sp.]|nr:glycosyl-4,4'-diaponeurosporenoate acyltransferase [Clostridium sp.]
MHYEHFPYRPLSFEKDGKIYNFFHIHRWRDKLPDMSKIFPDIMPSKKLPEKITSAQLERMVQETCVAELIHNLLGVLGFGCVLLWKGAGGWIIAFLYMIGNIPFSIIQRYNRPKLVQIMKKVKCRELKNVN